ncbi:hypothetical protein CN307_04360 [Bacillus cereus]|uniref:Uncharacterized protein n=1 Tax=Bacillus cereus TaxID=1396 RepID=A0A2A9A6Y4_BACCE|nr:hypothetical protein CN307_04360 [Bacillus cereus]
MNYVIFETIPLKNRIDSLLRLYKCLFYNNYDFLILLKGYDYFLIHVAIHNEKAVNDLISIHVDEKRVAKIFIP